MQRIMPIADKIHTTRLSWLTVKAISLRYLKKYDVLSVISDAAPTKKKSTTKNWLKFSLTHKNTVQRSIELSEEQFKLSIERFNNWNKSNQSCRRLRFRCQNSGKEIFRALVCLVYAFSRLLFCSAVWWLLTLWQLPGVAWQQGETSLDLKALCWKLLEAMLALTRGEVNKRFARDLFGPSIEASNLPTASIRTCQVRDFGDVRKLEDFLVAAIASGTCTEALTTGLVGRNMLSNRLWVSWLSIWLRTNNKHRSKNGFRRDESAENAVQCVSQRLHIGSQQHDWGYDQETAPQHSLWRLPQGLLLPQVKTCWTCFWLEFWLAFSFLRMAKFVSLLPCIRSCPSWPGCSGLKTGACI